MVNAEVLEEAATIDEVVQQDWAGAPGLPTSKWPCKEEVLFINYVSEQIEKLCL